MEETALYTMGQTPHHRPAKTVFLTVPSKTALGTSIEKVGMGIFAFAI